MTIAHQTSPGWLVEFIQLVAQQLRQLYSEQLQQGPTWQRELKEIEERINRLVDSIESGKLDVAASETLETRLNEAHTRKRQLESKLQQLECFEERIAQQVQPQQVICQLMRLSEALKDNDPTRTNLELSMFYDRIVGCSDGTIILRTCKLGGLPDVVGQLSVDSGADPVPGKKTRRRGKLRVTSVTRSKDYRAQANFIADPKRFANLGEEWFWTDRISIPKAVSWPVANAEAVFRRRQELKCSYPALAKEFGVSPPTIGAAIRIYEREHPGEKDNVKLARGGKRKRKFDLSAFAAEAKRLWLAEISQEELAKRYGCSPPTVVKAIEFAWAQEGKLMPTTKERRLMLIAEIQRLDAAGETPETIAMSLEISIEKVKKLLR